MKAFLIMRYVSRQPKIIILERMEYTAIKTNCLFITSSAVMKDKSEK